jgi:hypothetical protein
LIFKAVSPTNWIPAFAGMTDISGTGIFSQPLRLSTPAGRLGRPF